MNGIVTTSITLVDMVKDHPIDPEYPTLSQVVSCEGYGAMAPVPLAVHSP